MLEEQLEKFGLSEKEAKTYLALLELGESPVTEVSKAADINRSTAYVVLEALEKKGLVSNIKSAGKQTFRSAPPEKLTQIAEENLKKHQEVHDAIKRIVPDLRGVDIENAKKPIIRILEGKEGLMASFQDSIDNNQEKFMRAVSSVKEVSNLLPKSFFPNYLRQRKEN